MTWQAPLRTAATSAGAGDRADALAEYVEAFHRWNQRINLSASRTLEELASHVVDCLALLPHVPPRARLVDVGSGGGLPGLVLAISRPDLHVTCIEPIHKKAAFLRQVSRQLAVAVAVMTHRVNDLPELRGAFDVATSRATFDLAAWLEVGSQLVRPGGLVLAMEGLDQTALPPGALRHPYSFEDRTRAIITFRSPASPPSP